MALIARLSSAREEKRDAVEECAQPVPAGPSDLGVAEGDESDRYTDAEPERAHASLGGSYGALLASDLDSGRTRADDQARRLLPQLAHAP